MNTRELSDIARSGRETVKGRPTLDPSAAHEYLDWIANNIRELASNATLPAHLTLAELLTRIRMGNAQDKATQHTLVEQGIIDPPPTAS